MLFTKRPFTGVNLRYALAVCVLVCVFMAGAPAFAQQADTANKTLIDLSADVVIGFKTDSGDISKFIGNAVFHQGTDTLYCDSLYQNKATNIIEAFSNVKIVQQGGTQGKSDYLRYIANMKLAYMHGNVSLTDGKNELYTEDLTYDLGTKVGSYYNGGTLHNDSTDVTSRTGVYNVKSKDVRFTGKAVIVDPEYRINSEDMEYNTDTKVTRFYSKSTVTSDSGKSILQTWKGTYDGKKGIAHFTGHSSIWNDGEYIEGDSLDYNKLTGYGLGIGHVISIDTAHHSTLYCGRLEYFHKSRVLWASIKPVMEQVNGKDTFYMRGDTFYSAPMVKIKTPKPKVKAVPKNEDSTFGSATANDTADKWVDVKRSTGADSTAIAGDSVLATVIDSIFPVAINKIITATVLDTLKTTLGSVKDTGTVKGKTKKGADTTKLVVKPPPEFIWVVPTGPKYRKLDTTHYNLKPVTIVPVTKKKGKRGIASIDSVAVADTTGADTTAPMYFVAWNHVLLFSDSMQGKCDSVVYTRSDTAIRMINRPIAWAHNSQITGDTIIMYMDSSSMKSMYVPDNALVVSQSGPVKAGLFDQVQGRTLTAWFKNNEITSMLVFPDAECIYYSKDERDAYMGVNQGSSVRMRLYFEDQKIINIKFQQDVHQTVTPMEKADLPNTKLSRFQWLIDERPQSKEELFK